MADQDMPGFRGMRYSKFRHVYGNPYRREKCYNNIPITKNSHDAFFCAVNPKFVAVVLESQGGGAFLVIPIDKYGRQDALNNRLTGHKGPVLDIKWNPFNDNEIASCSDDGTAKVWYIPDDSVPTENNATLLADLVKHTRRVIQIEWHPTASGILLSASQDNKIIIWDVQQEKVFKIIDCHRDRINCVAWSWVGDLLATTSKDKKIRIIDARSGEVLKIGEGHTGTKSSKVAFAGNTDYLVTTGTARSSTRQIAVWKQDDLSKPMEMMDIDSGTGVQLLFYDPDSRVAFVGGKGDGSIRYFEISPGEEPCIFRLNEFITSMPQCGMGIMPKRGLDRKQCELVRFYKLHVSKGVCEPVSMIVPRKSEAFQEDIYPPTPSNEPALTAQSWIAGMDSPPKMVRLEEHGTSSVASTPVRPSLRESVIQTKAKAPSKSEDAGRGLSSRPTKEEGMDSSYTPSWSSSGTRVSSTRRIELSSPSMRREEVEKENVVPAESSSLHSAPPPAPEPEVSTLSEVSSISSSHSGGSEGHPSIASRMAMFEDGSKRGWRRTGSVDSGIPSSSTKIILRDTIREDDSSVFVLKDSGDRSPQRKSPRRTFSTESKEVIRIEREPERERGTSMSLEDQMIRSNGDGSETAGKASQSASDVNTRRDFMTSKDLGMDQLSPGEEGTMLRKAYLRQQEEIKQLKSQLMLKDQRIRQLEREIEDLTLSSEA
ncbi:coronin-2B-like isoform X2 [Acanthaster planci]|uniref:Coronin n=1 Tax=Acanthaster planci TaxID=133434 RepID=A0A8B7XXX9_ACAPL|nr:coronin-2B-like isoform X2 [Acanthaster planci]XP_022085085.1 coronin-2B-like isoform X2 [Acanthaster planci]XP_022085094.1 coronin-2B-like isoform X2 [Acanthaster planci]XP_022085104.1 coronin-2B-like isoform X2 [Acanthaster planci]XP_022085112.1 coronin-2B-like isoform X2 [Acanthaster planci]